MKKGRRVSPAAKEAVMVMMGQMISLWCFYVSCSTRGVFGSFPIKIHIPKLYENIPFHNFNVTHAGTKNHQVTRTVMENQGNTLINTEKMKVDENELVLIKNRLHH